MYITFCGHNEIPFSDELKLWLQEVLEQLILQGANRFYLGGYGGFDRLAAELVREQKQRHTEIQAILVLPYLNAKIDRTGYDSTCYPPLEHVPPRLAIVKRNQWMVETSDVVIAYVTHSWGGAAKTLEWSKRKKKLVVQYPNREPVKPSGAKSNRD